MSEDKKEILFFILFGIFLAGTMILIVFIESWENGFKTERQICEENGGVYIEDLSSHNQHQCMYGLKGE
jgi:hypothetical protein